VDVHGVSVRESELSDGYQWEWSWPNIQTVERELRWSTEAHKWVVGIRVDNAGWNFQTMVGPPWSEVRSVEKAREEVEKFVARDIGKDPG